MGEAGAVIAARLIQGAGRLGGNRMRKAWADAARGMAIITVVFFHVSLELARAGPVHWSAWALINFFAPFPMTIFFLVAGHFSRSLLTGRWNARIGIRLAGLAYVFAVWSLLRWGVLALYGDASQPRILDYVVDPRTPLWFLWALIAYTALAALIPSRRRWIAFAAASTVALLSFTEVLSFDSFVYENLVRFFPFFLLGLAAANGDGSLERRRLAVLVGGGALFCLLALLTVRLSPPQPLLGLLQSALTGLAAPVGVAAASVAASAPGLGRLVQKFGRASLGVYLLHSVAIIGVTALWRGTGATLGAAWPTPFVATLAVLAVSLGLAAATQRLGWTWLYRPPFAEKVDAGAGDGRAEAEPSGPSGIFAAQGSTHQILSPSAVRRSSRPARGGQTDAP